MTTQANDPLFAAQAESMLETLFRRPQGFVNPQLEGVDYRRCAEVAAYLAETGRAEATPAPYGGMRYQPSAAERERKAEASKKAFADVLAAVTGQPDIRTADLASVLPNVPEELLTLAVNGLIGGGAIRETEGQLVTAELAAERDADRAAEDALKRANEPIDIAWLKSTGNYREQSIDRAVAKLEASGDLEHLASGLVEVSTALDRRMRELVFAASEASFLKKARGVSPADVAAELEIGEDHAAAALYGLMLRRWFVREVRGNQFYYTKA